VYEYSCSLVRVNLEKAKLEKLFGELDKNFRPPLYDLESGAVHVGRRRSSNSISLVEWHKNVKSIYLALLNYVSERLVGYHMTLAVQAALLCTYHRVHFP